MKRQRLRARTGAQSTGHKTYQIGVPWQIAEVLPDHLEYEAELTDVGLLFRPVLTRRPQSLPAWATGRPEETP
jgi:hypothetical protein